MKKLFILGVLFTSLVLSAFPATIIKEVGVDVIYENNDSNVNKFIYSKEFSNYLSKFEKNVKAENVINNLVLASHLNDINTNIYNVRLNNIEIHIIENLNSKNFEVVFQKNKENSIQLFDRIGNEIVKVILDNGRVSEYFYFDAIPSLKCIRATVAFMKDSCTANDGCAVLCDLMSTACTNQMYIVAIAHCAANNNMPPVSGGSQ